MSRHWPWGLRIGLAAALPVVVTIDLLVGGPLTGLDHTVHRFAESDVRGLWKQIALTVRLLGQRWILLHVLVPLALIAAVRARSPRPVLMTGLIVVGLSAFEQVAKSIVPRTYPVSGEDQLFVGGRAYPSGHTLNTFLLVWTVLELAVIAFPRLAESGGLTARRLVIIARVTGVVVGMALTLAGVHWLSDVLASLGLGVVLLDLLVWADPFRAGRYWPAGVPTAATTMYHTARRWRFMLGTAVVSLLVSAAGWRGVDYPAMDLRIEIVRHGHWFWNPDWFGGHPTLGYSTLFPVVGALVGATGLGVLATTGAVGVFEALVRDRAGGTYATAAFAFAMLSNLVVGRLQFALGAALALAAVAALSRSRVGAAGTLAALTSLTSPLAALFLAIALVAWAVARGRPWASGWLVAAALVPAMTTSVFFGTGGSFPFPLRTLVWSLALCGLAGLVSTESMVRIGCVLTAALCLAAFVVHSPLGANVGRLPFLLSAPLLVLGSRRSRGALLVASVGVAMVTMVLATQIVQVAYATESDPSTTEGYYDGVISYLIDQPGPTRVEIPFTAQHWETFYVAEHIPIARGWERQADRQRNPEFYDKDRPLDARIYDAWLLRNHVTHVALPDSDFDPSSRTEAQLIRGGLNYLRPVFRDRHWTVFIVEQRRHRGQIPRGEPRGRRPLRLPPQRPRTTPTSPRRGLLGSALVQHAFSTAMGR